MGVLGVKMNVPKTLRGIGSETSGYIMKTNILALLEHKGVIMDLDYRDFDIVSVTYKYYNDSICEVEAIIKLVYRQYDEANDTVKEWNEAIMKRATGATLGCALGALEYNIYRKLITFWQIMIDDKFKEWGIYE